MINVENVVMHFMRAKSGLKTAQMNCTAAQKSFKYESRQIQDEMKPFSALSLDQLINYSHPDDFTGNLIFDSNQYYLFSF